MPCSAVVYGTAADDDPRAPTAEISALYVAPDLRRRGIGAALLRAAAAELAQPRLLVVPPRRADRQPLRPDGSTKPWVDRRSAGGRSTKRAVRFPSRSTPGRDLLALSRLENGHRDRAPRLLRVPGDLGRLGQDGVAPHGVARVSVQLADAYDELAIPDLHVCGGGLAQVLEPVGVAARTGSSAPDDESRRRLEVPDTGRAGDAGAAAGDVIIRTWTFLLPLDIRPSRRRYIHTPMRLPTRSQRRCIHRR